MEYNILGNTGHRVSRLCFGSLTLSPLQANLSLAEGAALIRYALECGINFIDTAKFYNNYPYIRKALRGWDKPVVIASKSYDYTKEGMAKSLEEARLALDRDVMDIFMLHEQESELTLAGHKPALEYLWEAKARGWVKAVGVSTHTIEVVKAAAEREDLEVLHPIVNMEGLGITDGTLAELLPALAKAHAKGKGIYGMKPLGGGNLISKSRKALEFAFKVPYLHSVAVGCKHKDELDYNLSILEGKEPSEELAARLESLPRRLYIEKWCVGCGSCVRRCPFGQLELREGRAVLSGRECLLCGYCAAVCPQFAIKVI